MTRSVPTFLERYFTRTDPCALQNKTERFEVFVDGTSVGKTNDFTVERSSHCGANADKCIEKGWGRELFPYISQCVS